MKKQKPMTIKELKEHAIKIEPTDKQNALMQYEDEDVKVQMKYETRHKLPKKKKLDFEAIALIIALFLCIVFIFIMASLFTSCTSKVEPDIVATYESSLDEMSIDFDDETLEYDVWVNNSHHFVSIDNVKVLPYYKNEAVLEIDSNNKCYLYIFIEFEENKCI